MQTNPKRTNLAVPANGAGFLAVTLTQTDSKVVITEDPAVNNGAPQGLTGYYADTQPGSGFPQTGSEQVWLPQTAGQYGPGYQPIAFGGLHVHGPFADYVGAQGTIVLYLSSLTNLPTGIILEEWT